MKIVKPRTKRAGRKSSKPIPTQSLEMLSSLRELQFNHDPIADLGVQVSNILRPDALGGGVALKDPAFDKQKVLVESPIKRIIVRAGRRGGKTVGVAIKAVRAFLAGRRVLYAAPTAEQITRFWTEVTQALQESITAGLYRKNETEHRIELKGTDQCIRAKTAWNADSLRGDYGDLLIIDEWQLCSEDMWERVGAPMLLDNDGDAVFIYTPPSLRSKSVTKARDPQHASKMFKRAEEAMKKAAEEGTVSRWLAIHWSSHDNPTISETALAEITQDMTQLSYNQEIMAEDATEVPGALWKQDWIDATRVEVNQVPDLEKIVVGVDPSGSTTTEAGIVCSGRGSAPHGWIPSPEIIKRTPNLMVLQHIYILDDDSLAAPSPIVWSQAAVTRYYERKADRLFGERNYGGDMVESTIRQAHNGQAVSYSDANATRGKIVRAEPVAAAYQRGLVHHVGQFPELENEMCSYVPGISKSPNRMDAMVWGALRLLEGIDVLGLLDYFKTGQAEAEYDSMDKSPKLTAPVVPVSVGCPECGAPNMQEIPGGRRCQQCGIQTTSKTNGNAHGVTRDSYLRGDWGPPR